MRQREIGFVDVPIYRSAAAAAAAVAAAARAATAAVRGSGIQARQPSAAAVLKKTRQMASVAAAW